MLVLLILLSASHAYAQAVISDMGYYRVDTLNYFLNHFPGNIPMSLCDGTDCTHFGTTNGGQINTSAFTAGQYVYIQQAADGEAFTFQAIAPDGTIWGENTLTYTASNQCFTWSGNTSDRATEAPPILCGNSCGSNPCVGPYVYAWSGPTLPCIWNGTALAGTWTLKLTDSANPGSPLTHTFSLQHNQNSQLGIISPIPQSPQPPLDNALVDLAADQNYSATDATCGPPVPTNNDGSGYPSAACYSAVTLSGNSINWTTQLQYFTSAYKTTGVGTQIIDSPRSFNTPSGNSQHEVYQNEGGQVQVTATSTAADGSSVEDCTTFYVEGPAGGIPGPEAGANDVITPALVNLYTKSASYPKDGTATSNLMTGIAERETNYRQFTSPEDNPPNSDLWSLYVSSKMQIAAKWPDENVQTSKVQRGAYIGLMQRQTAGNQQSDPNAWKWADPDPTAPANANDAVNLFSGTVSPNEIQLATTYETDIINGVPSLNIPGYLNGDGSPLGQLNGFLPLENMALVLYAGDVNLQQNLATILTEQYYTPQCQVPGVQGTKKKGKQIIDLTCSTAWQWVPNTVNQVAGLNYVQNGKDGVRDQLQQ